MKNKTARFEMRMNPIVKEQLENAAKSAGYRSIADFMTDTSIRRANDMGVFQKVRTHKDQVEMFV